MRKIRTFGVALVALVAVATIASAQGGNFSAQIENFWRLISTGGRTFTTMSATRVLVGDGTAAAPSVTFANHSGMGFYASSPVQMAFTPGSAQTYFAFSSSFIMAADASLWWTNAVANALGTGDLSLSRDAPGILAQKNGTNAQTQRWYFSTTGPIHYGLVATAVGPRLVATGSAMQLNTAQTTAPTCTSNCGTSPSVAGTDTAGIVTMGAAGVPASGWVVTFNGTWAAAPACTVQMALAGMVVGKAAVDGCDHADDADRRDQWHRSGQ